jgi:hypothetical protein
VVAALKAEVKQRAFASAVEVGKANAATVATKVQSSRKRRASGLFADSAWTNGGSVELHSSVS